MEQKIFAVIYKITNLVNGKVYIGQTTGSPKRRLNRHVSDARARRSNSPLQNAIMKYGVENFTFDVVICAFDRESTNLLEKFFIKEHKSNTKEFGYNLTDGGEGMDGYRHTEEAKRKLSLVGKDRQHSEKSKQKISLGNKGKVISEETKQKQRLTMVGRRATEKTKQKMSLVRKGRKISDETKQKRTFTKFVRPVEQLSIDGVLLNEYPSLTAAENSTDIDKGCICQVCKGKQKTAGGFLWRYVSYI